MKRFIGKISKVPMHKNLVAGTAVLVISGMGIFPPWVFKAHLGARTSTKDLGYAFIGVPPVDTYFGDMGQIDYSRLLLQWAIVVVIASGLIYISAPRQRAE
jgi:hypothetical protein